MELTGTNSTILEHVFLCSLFDREIVNTFEFICKPFWDEDIKAKYVSSRSIYYINNVSFFITLD